MYVETFSMALSGKLCEINLKRTGKICLVFKAFPDAAEELYENRFPLAHCIQMGVSDSITLDVLHQFPGAALAHPAAAIFKEQQHMLLFAVLCGVSDSVAEALQMEALAHVSRMLSEHRMLYPCVSPVPLRSVASLDFASAHIVLAEGDGLKICVRFLRAWHHGEALHAAFLQLSLAKVCPPDAAQSVVAMLYGQCRGAECSCRCVVARWRADVAF